MVGCPTCGAELTYLDRYTRHYCYGCRAYAPRKLRPCATCNRALVFVPQHGRFYCYGCEEYKEGEGTASPCPNCREALEYVAQYGRYFCTGCHEYAPKDYVPVAGGGRPMAMTKAQAPATGFAPFSREEMDLASKDQLIQWCKEYKLDESGMKYELRLRLLEHIRRQGLLLKGEEALEEEGAATQVEADPGSSTPPSEESAVAAGGGAQSAVVEVPAEAGGQTGCQQCGGDLTYIPQYDRWYCYSCDTYAPAEGTGLAQAPEVAFRAGEMRGPKGGIALAAVGLVMFVAHQVLYVAPALFPIPILVTAPEIAFGLSFLGPVFVAAGLMAAVLRLRPRG